MSEQINTQWTADTIQDFLRDHSEELKVMVWSTLVCLVN
jgi:hypothetical protein